MQKSKLSFLIFFFCLGSLAARVVSPFNRLELKDTSEDYSFVVSGHFYGSSCESSGYPAATLLAGIDTLNGLHASFMISLGDMFMDVNDGYIRNYQKSLFSKLQMPLFNAVGNHDVANGNLYAKVFGPSWYSFRVQDDVFILLDTETDDGSISAEQLVFLTGALKASGAAKNIFIFSHRPVWAENSSRYGKLFRGNTRTAIGSNNFETVVRPLAEQYAKGKNIVWMSGSFGGGPASFFYDKEPTGTFTFIQTAIRNAERDAVLLVNVRNGKVSFSGISLTGQELQPLEKYDMNYWQETVSPEEKFNFRMLPYYTKLMLMSRYFWLGVLFSLIAVFVFSSVLKKWKKRK
jgi:hypothetical protein